jgi:tetratricopeptide (TPR) repeat protein
VITFAVAALGANSTDFGFLVAVAIGWVAFAIPRGPEVQIGVTEVRRRFGTLASLACFAVVAAAWTATAAADVSYLSARSAIGEGRLDEALPRLELARSLDPGMALYVRQLGTAQLLTGDAPAAIQNLDDAVHLNPSDDLALRILALAHSAIGDSNSAWAALERAIETQRSDPTNLLLEARWQVEDGHYEEALATLGEVVQAWPEIVAAPGWSELLPPTISTRDVIQKALDRWSRDLPSPAPRGLQPMLLAVMAGSGEVAQASTQETLGHAMGAAYAAVMGCEPTASTHLQQAPDQARRTALYWSLVARQAALDGEADDRAARLIQIMTNGSLLSAGTDETLNPLTENGHGGYSADIWGYRRSPITWPDYDSLPSWQAGVSRWLLEPREAVHSAGLDTVLRACR